MLGSCNQRASLRYSQKRQTFQLLSLINIHAPTNDLEEEAKNQFYEQLERAYAACPSHDVKLVMGDANAKIGRETVYQPTIGKHSLHERTNENGLRLVDFAAGRQMAIKSTYIMHKRIHLPTWHSPGPQMETPSTRSITA
jgi:hypothetical protein